MSAVGLESIDHMVQLTQLGSMTLTHHWMGKTNTVLTACFEPYRQAMRDWLMVDEAAGFGAQLPELLRGVYYEHWRPATTPIKKRSKADFPARIDNAFKSDPISFTPDAVTTVFRLLSDNTAGEIQHVHHALPADIRALWPLPSRAA